jgi:F-type H+-transporting ATPase subunit b
VSKPLSYRLTFRNLLSILVLASMALPASTLPSASAEAEPAGDVAAADDHGDHGDHGDHEADDATSSHAGDGHSNDNSHKNAGPTMMHPQEFKSDLAVYTFIVFILLLLILYKFAWGPISDGLAKREEGIANQIDQARQDAEAAQESLKQYQQQLEKAAQEAQQILAEARQDAEAARDRTVAEAREAAQREHDRALADIQIAKQAALDEVATLGTNIAVNLAGQIVRKELNAADHASLISESIDQFSSNN